MVGKGKRRQGWESVTAPYQQGAMPRGNSANDRHNLDIKTLPGRPSTPPIPCSQWLLMVLDLKVKPNGVPLGWAAPWEKTEMMGVEEKEGMT